MMENTDSNLTAGVKVLVTNTRTAGTSQSNQNKTKNEPKTLPDLVLRV